MSMLELFYNEILDETTNGRVDCNMMYNVLFETNIDRQKYIFLMTK